MPSEREPYKGNWTNRWLDRVRVTDDPVGDVIADMKGERDIPDLFRSLDEMRDYLMLKRACPQAIAAVPRVWRKYRRWLDAHPWGDTEYETRRFQRK